MKKQDTYHHDNLREKLIDAGLTIIEEEGTQNLSLRRVANVCGASHGSPYRHFKNKEDFILTLVIEVSKKFAEYIGDFQHHDHSPEDNILEMGVRFVQFSIEYPNYFELLFLSDYVISTRVNGEDQLVMDKQLSGFEIFKKHACEFMNYYGIDEKEDYILIELWSFVLGLSIISRGGNLKGGEQDLVRQIISNTLNRFLKG
ncbi:MAG TPA: TetR/AcrR family transcriptional regulator [Bacillales bacterium]|nr:TetR/AcrR family transcriptional regulator [Bacillales bacterium]